MGKTTGSPFAADCAWTMKHQFLILIFLEFVLQPIGTRAASNVHSIKSQVFFLTIVPGR